MRLRGLLLTLATSCLFGLGAVLAKILGEGFQPFFVSWLALSGGGLCILICQLLRRKPLLPPAMTRASWIDIFLFASIGTALPLVCIIIGLPQTGAITGSFLLQLQSPATLIFALLFLKERMRGKQLAGMLLLFVGSLLVIWRAPGSSLQFSGGWGALLVIIAAVGIGFSYIPAKRLTKYGDALQMNLLRLLVGSALFLPLLPFQTPVMLAPLTLSLVGALVLYSVANFGLGYIFLQAGIGLLQAWEASAIMQTLPLFSTVFAILLLHESLTLLQIIGGCIILVGGFLLI